MNNSSSQDDNKPTSIKNEIIALIKHDEVEQLFKRFLSHAQKSHRSKVIINAIVIFLGFLIGIGAFYLAYQASTDETAIANKRAYDQAKAINVAATVRRKIEWMKKMNSSVINMRKVRYHILLRCKHGHPDSLEKQELLRLNAALDVIHAFTGSQFIFNDAVQKKVDQLIKFDRSVKNVCAKGAPKDDKWRAYLIEIDNLMGQSIKEDQETLMELSKS